MKNQPSSHIHKNAIIIDMVCPLLDEKQYVDDYIKGGLTIVAPTVAINDNCSETMEKIGDWYQYIHHRKNQLMHIKTVEDIYRAKTDNKLGILFHFQNSQPFEKSIGLVEVYYRLGVRSVQITYNTKNYIGDGCDELTDAGLSRFGVNIIAEMNRVGMVVDVSHTGYKTTMEAIEVSKDPVIFSHSNTKAVCESIRNIRDDQIKAIGKNQGVIGINGFPAFVSKKKEQPSIDDLLRNVDHIANLIGTEHISLGLDYYTAQWPYAKDAQAQYERLINSGEWNSQTYPPPPYKYPKGIETPAQLENLTKGLVDRGYTEPDIKKILGENLIRIFKRVWK